MDDPVHVQIQVVVLDAVRVGRARVERHGPPVVGQGRRLDDGVDENARKAFADPAEKARHSLGSREKARERRRGRPTIGSQLGRGTGPQQKTQSL